MRWPRAARASARRSDAIQWLLRAPADCHSSHARRGKETVGLQLFSHRETSRVPSETGSNPGGVKLRDVLASPSAIIATDFGFGLCPVGPGTVGSVLALPLVWLLSSLDGIERLLVYAVLFPLLAIAAHRAGPVLGEQDHPSIICDETWAMAVVWESTSAGYGWMAASFLAFRFFDIVKPGPIAAIDRSMKSGLGVMLDDALAALYAVILIAAAHAVMPIGW
jgi:phosphatidylglycerophosphatase A